MKTRLGTVNHNLTVSELNGIMLYLLQVLQVIDACTDIAYNVTAPAAGGVVSSRYVFLCWLWPWHGSCL